ncbi:MAG: N-6 DNA methylase [Lachnospiraceae bacterium]|nr:N-6 DNA methylase [Lachnospiraceae bacterium]
MNTLISIEDNATCKMANPFAQTQVHASTVLQLCRFYCQEQNITVPDNFFITTGVETDVILPLCESHLIPRLCENLHIAFLNSKYQFHGKKVVRIKSKENLMERGAVYTKGFITDFIVKNTLKHFRKPLAATFKILDFACGTGRFYESVVWTLRDKFGIDVEKSICHHIHAFDVDPIAINILRLKALSFIENPTMEHMTAIIQNIIVKDGLILPQWERVSNDIECYDAIVSNPPYLVLKPNKNKMDDTTVRNICNMVSYFRGCGLYSYSLEGMLNLYQLSIEAMLRMLKKGGELGVICPSTLFADMSATRLRKYLLLQNKIHSICYFPEEDKLFENVTQATSVFYLKKGGKTEEIEIEEGKDSLKVSLSLVKMLFPKQMEIPAISPTEWTILKKISHNGKLKNLLGIRNRRGELDLSLLKKYITRQPSPYRLVRGNMIGEKEIKDINGEYVSVDFLKAKGEDYIENDFNRRRLVCQQISNMGCGKRLKFVFCEKSDILGNSCNYISGDPITLSRLFLVLNSSILNWRFKVTSSNNHINNYELDELPILDLETIDPNFKYNSQEELDQYVGAQYGLEPQEISYIATR